MTLIIQNQTAGTKTYLGGSVVVAGSSNLTVPTNFVFPIARDGGLVKDCFSGDVFLSDGTNVYAITNATDYLNQIATGILGAVVGLIASSVPNYAVMVGGKGPSGNATLGAMDVNGYLMMNESLAISGQNRAQSVSSAAEALGGSTILTNRKFITITPTNGTVYWGFTSGVTTTTGLPIFKNQTTTIAASDTVHIYVVSGSTVDCRIAEGS